MVHYINVINNKDDSIKEENDNIRHFKGIPFFFFFFCFVLFFFPQKMNSEN